MVNESGPATVKANRQNKGETKYPPKTSIKDPGKTFAIRMATALTADEVANSLNDSSQGPGIPIVSLRGSFLKGSQSL